MVNDLNLLAINLTQRCNLACAHCYLDAKTMQEGLHGELACTEVCALLDQVAEQNPDAMVVLTGGEPLLRPDLESIISHGVQRKLFMVVGTNGTLLTERRVKSLKAAGLMGAGISVDSVSEAKHDTFRGKPGSWQKTMQGLNNCRKHNISFQIHFTVTTDTVREVDDIIRFSQQQGARVVNIFFLICTGRGETVTDITPDQYEQVLRNILSSQSKYPDMIIRPRCAPHFKRVALELNPDSMVNRISGSEGDGCLAGASYCRITPTGGVTACPYIDEEIANIRETSFAEIWNNTPQFQLLREPELEGKCGLCEYRSLCGGCRARPYAMGLSLMASDPWCQYEPRGGAEIIPVNDLILEEIVWQEEARIRISRIPGFIRKMVKKRTETYVAEKGEKVVTCQHLDQLIARRFGDKLPFKRLVNRQD